VWRVLLKRASRQKAPVLNRETGLFVYVPHLIYCLEPLIPEPVKPTLLKKKIAMPDPHSMTYLQ
jgi:hypothetical protein